MGRKIFNFFSYVIGFLVWAGKYVRAKFRVDGFVHRTHWSGASPAWGYVLAAFRSVCAFFLSVINTFRAIRREGIRAEPFDLENSNLNEKEQLKNDLAEAKIIGLPEENLIAFLLHRIAQREFSVAGAEGNSHFRYRAIEGIKKTRIQFLKQLKEDIVSDVWTETSLRCAVENSVENPGEHFDEKFQAPHPASTSTPLLAEQIVDYVEGETGVRLFDVNSLNDFSHCPEQIDIPCFYQMMKATFAAKKIIRDSYYRIKEQEIPNEKNIEIDTDKVLQIPALQKLLHKITNRLTSQYPDQGIIQVLLIIMKGAIESECKMSLNDIQEYQQSLRQRRDHKALKAALAQRKQNEKAALSALRRLAQRDYLIQCWEEVQRQKYKRDAVFDIEDQRLQTYFKHHGCIDEELRNILHKAFEQRQAEAALIDTELMHSGSLDEEEERRKKRFHLLALRHENKKRYRHIFAGKIEKAARRFGDLLGYANVIVMTGFACYCTYVLFIGIGTPLAILWPLVVSLGLAVGCVAFWFAKPFIVEAWSLIGFHLSNGLKSYVQQLTWRKGLRNGIVGFLFLGMVVASAFIYIDSNRAIARAFLMQLGVSVAMASGIASLAAIILCAFMAVATLVFNYQLFMNAFTSCRPADRLRWSEACQKKRRTRYIAGVVLAVLFTGLVAFIAALGDYFAIHTTLNNGLALAWQLILVSFSFVGNVMYNFLKTRNGLIDYADRFTKKIARACKIIKQYIFGHGANLRVEPGDTVGMATHASVFTGLNSNSASEGSVDLRLEGENDAEYVEVHLPVYGSVFGSAAVTSPHPGESGEAEAAQKNTGFSFSPE